MKSKSIVCIGGGGHARVVMDAIRSQGAAWNLIGYTNLQPPSPADGNPFPYLGEDTALEKLRRDGVHFAVLGVGSIGNWKARQTILQFLRGLDFEWGVVKHAQAYCAQETMVGEGTVIFAHAAINVGARIGDHCIINTGAIVEHDCQIEDWVHIAPGACLGGAVSVGRGTHIGLGARIREGVIIGGNVLVGAGSLVIKDVPDNVVLVGSPVRMLRKRPGSMEV